MIKAPASTGPVTAKAVATRGLWHENPVLVQTLGLCSALAVTNAVSNSLAMGIATTFVLVGSSLVVSALRRIVMIAFGVSGALSAFGGVLLAGYASKAAQGMGDAYLLPAIAAVVLGGTSILGGRGSYLGTVAGVILITLLQSILSVMQMPEAGRQIIYGVVIIGMLLLYGRAPASRQ